MDNKQAKQLYEKYLTGNCTPEELALIKRAYNKTIPEDVEVIKEERYTEMSATIWSNLKNLDRPDVRTYPLWPKIAVAAMLVITTGIGLHFFSQKNTETENLVVSVYHNDVPAGGNKAVLTLANGKTIHLSNTKSGVVINASALNYSDGTTIENSHTKVGEIASITTPRGGKYTIELPDGTIVALNASSTLKFPSSFSGLVNRSVELTGEGYFKVAKDKKHPFIVKSNGQEVEVLGTEFNISNYADETTIKTTLIEGSVKILNLKSQISNLLKPGQQAELLNHSITVNNVDTESVTAWKNGDFMFSEDIKTIMRQISRWYDVEVVYQGKISDQEFLGTFSRSKSVVEILKALELTKRVHFKVEGRRITVMP